MPNFPGATFIQGGTFIPDSRVSHLTSHYLGFLVFSQPLPKIHTSHQIWKIWNVLRLFSSYLCMPFLRPLRLKAEFELNFEAATISESLAANLKEKQVNSSILFLGLKLEVSNQELVLMARIRSSFQMLILTHLIFVGKSIFKLHIGNLKPILINVGN